MQYYKRVLLQQFTGLGVSGAAGYGAAGNADNAHGSNHASRMMMNRSPRIFLDPYSFIERTPHNTIFNIVPQGH